MTRTIDGLGRIFVPLPYSWVKDLDSTKKNRVIVQINDVGDCLIIKKVGVSDKAEGGTPLDSTNIFGS